MVGDFQDWEKIPAVGEDPRYQKVFINRACPVECKPMKWISVDERLPEIPDGQHGVSVIVAVYDMIFAEFNFEGGYEVYQAEFDNDGVFKNITYPDGDLIPIGDKVTHWMPLPDPPVVKK